MGPEMSQQAGTRTPRTTTFNILFVCTGNTCRSPLAEGIVRAPQGITEMQPDPTLRISGG